MTIKRRMIITNILMLAAPVVLCLIVLFLLRIIFFYIFGDQGPPLPDEVESERFAEEPLMYLYFLGQMALITGIFFTSNMFFTRRLIGQIMAEHEKYENNRRELIAGISHDLRTPLAVIKAYLEGIETGVASTAEKQEKYFNIIKNKTNDLEHITNQLFLFSKLDIGEYPVTMQKIDLGHTLPEMMGELADEYERRGLSIIQGHNVENVFINADYLQLRNVIINILENSVKYKNTEKGVLVFTCSVFDKTAVITLTDNGPGVPHEALDKLFDVFYRTDPSRNNEKNNLDVVTATAGTFTSNTSIRCAGSGLGLAIADKTIRRMGGTIHAELPENGGLAIVFRLPKEEEK
jgi:signal transduction histidine kinase